MVENDSGNAEVIEMILIEENHNVLTIQQSYLLDLTVAKFLPDLIIMDILLDNQDGRLLSNNLKMQRRTCHIPIMLITAMMEAQAKSIECYADCLMLKPFDYSVLIKKIKSMIH